MKRLPPPGRRTVRLIKDVKAGEVLTVSYLTPEDTYSPTAVRRMLLWNSKEFFCKCESCCTIKEEQDSSDESEASSSKESVKCTAVAPETDKRDFLRDRLVQSLLLSSPTEREAVVASWPAEMQQLVATMGRPQGANQFLKFLIEDEVERTVKKDMKGQGRLGGGDVGAVVGSSMTTAQKQTKDLGIHTGMSTSAPRKQRATLAGSASGTPFEFSFALTDAEKAYESECADFERCAKIGNNGLTMSRLKRFINFEEKLQEPLETSHYLRQRYLALKIQACGAVGNQRRGPFIEYCENIETKFGIYHPYTGMSWEEFWDEEIEGATNPVSSDAPTVARKILTSWGTSLGENHSWMEHFREKCKGMGVRISM
ncbi:unnamed protein product [Amoebophrya sp. A25]|nr:unnamed protein product [Amoebophrya sp. A25]|eukprot:GSA25T00006981001.1